MRRTEYKRFRLGDWQVDSDSNSVSSGTIRRQLEPRAMDVLLFLAQQAPETVSSEQILENCCEGTFQGDNAVHKAITQLRRALDDSSNKPRYVETIRKRGYRLIAELLDDEDAATGSWMHGSPFRGLEAFEEQHAAIFFGRKYAVEQLLQTAFRQVRAGCAMVLVLGPSGCGKTSLIRAGFIPTLMGRPSDAGLAVACHLYLDCADLGNTDLFDALGSALLDAEVDGRLLFEADSAASLGARLAADVDAVVTQLRGRLQAIRLVLCIDRFEALFRLVHGGDEVRAHFMVVLERLARSGTILLVLACRNDFYPHLATFPELMRLKQRGGHFDLGSPTGTDIAEMIRQPARAAQLHFGIDEASGERLDNALCDAAKASPDSLPLLQYCLQELYRQRSASDELSYAAFRKLGGIAGAIGERAEQVFSSLTPAQARALPRVLSQLVIISETDLAVTSLRLPWAALRGPGQLELVKTLVEARLFISDLQGGQATFGVVHEALLRRWPRVANWIANHRQSLQIRSRLREQASRWRASAYRRDMLLPPGMQVNQASHLVNMAEFTFSEEEQAFVRASLHRARRARYLRLGAIGVLIGLTALASGLGLLARSAAVDADAHRTEAEGLMTFMLGEFVDRLRPLGRLDLLDSVSQRAMSYLSKEPRGSSMTLTQRAKALQLLSEVSIARADPVGANRALQLARAILLRQLQDTPNDIAVLKSAGENAFWLGQIHYDQKDWAHAGTYFAEYRELSNRLAAAAPGDPAGWVEQSYAHNSLGSLALQRGEIRRATDEFAESVRLKSLALARAPEDKYLADSLADSLSWQAESAKRQGKLAAASTLYQRELELITRLHETVPSNALWTNNLASALSHRAELERVDGNEPAALRYLERAEALLKSIVRQDPTNRTWQRNLYVAQLELFDIGANRIPASQAPQALAMLDRWQQELTALSRLEPKKVSLQLMLAKLKRRKAYIKLHFFSKKEASRDIITAVEEIERLQARAPDDLSIRDALTDALLLQASIGFAQHDPGSARKSCRKVMDLLTPSVPGSTDFHVLAPWIRSRLCLGADTEVATAIDVLKKMNYRERAYLHDIVNHHAKGSNE